MRIIHITLKDILQIIRDKRSLLFLLAMPVVFTLFIGFTYGNGDNGKVQNPPMSLAWVEDAPRHALSQKLYRRVVALDTLRLVHMGKEAALESLQRGDVDGVLVLPSEFGEVTQAGKLSQITLIADITSSKGQSLYQLLRVPIFQLMSAVKIGQLSVEIFSNPAEFGPAMEMAWEKWQSYNTHSPVRMEQAVVQESEPWFGDNPYNQASPGILVQFAVMGLMTTAQIMVQERKRCTLQRLMTTAIKPWEIVIGHILGMFFIVFLQMAMLVIFGQWVLGVNYLRAPLNTLLVLVALGLWISSMSLLIGLFAKNDQQVIFTSMIAMFVFSGLGGAWFPLQTNGGIIATISQILPSSWAMTGFQNILVRGLGLSSNWLPVCILIAYALGFFIIAVWRFRKVEV